MELVLPGPRFLPVLAVALVLIIPVYGQISTPCSASMITSFTPCINFVTNSTGNGTSPTAGCCTALKSLTSGGTDCLCLIVTGNVPFQMPINRTLAISLPRACNMPGVPLQCKSAGAPIPAPGPVSLAPTPSSVLSPITPSPKASSVPTPTSPAAQAPESDTTPSSPTVNSEAPTATSGSRPVLTASAALPSYSLSPFVLLLLVLGASVLNYN
ncbi:hypothetical protein CJ030_MR3G014443 [Morella rubra]|uniref:Bifunctional inhibitor/plant lipid transfer protein/seed storage helical domain-containing protein n=1 Tax=Morella rubra TaxID=262757 RepID=A0A6A1VPL5_9ROSI|nr:hypothetical protein CJ030_MR5G003258 [Morella rubra]KAB1218147.1 hypothetical protein CJ030_MR3G014443 [Morella rubra]